MLIQKTKNEKQKMAKILVFHEAHGIIVPYSWKVIAQREKNSKA